MSFYLLYKPPGIFFREFLNQKKKLLKSSKIGVEGILDPFAEGLMIAAIDEGTKFLPYFHELPKTYEGVIALGKYTSTWDKEGEVLKEERIPNIDPNEISSLRQKFQGNILYPIPPFSNVRYRGRRLREYAYKKEKIPTLYREGYIYEISFSPKNKGEIFFQAKVSKGFYLRSLAILVGEALGVSAYLSFLKRTHIGKISYHQVREEPYPIEELLYFLP